jgi:prepilin-type N-terminal cleavage/methylation domain-containing protein
MKRGQRAFTLIELLLAMSIMFMLLVLTATAFQLYSNYGQRSLSAIERSFQQFRHRELLLTSLQSTIPYAVTQKQLFGFYFLGRENGFTAVTANPVFDVDYPAVIRVFRERTQEGKFNLVYEEASLRGMTLLEADQNLPFNQRLVLLKDLQQINFSYFGWRDSSQKSQATDVEQLVFGPGPEKQWFGEYDGIQAQVHPEKIQLQLGTELLTVPVATRDNLGLKAGASGVDF